MSFFSWYFDTTSYGENAVKCPFPHSMADGTEYYEDTPSASVNTEKGVFHCMACDKGFNEIDFMKEVTGCTTSQAYEIKPWFQGNEDIEVWRSSITSVTYPIEMASSFGISKEVQEELMIATVTGSELQFPVFMYEKLIDTRTYIPTNKPKCRSRMDSVAGHIIPFDLWIDTPPERWTLICAGEKDMAVARSHGFNAITLTGGEGTQPFAPKLFKGRYVAICYDNDSAGFKGAKKLALTLHKHGAIVKIVTSFHIGMGDGEDITDYFNNYNKTRVDLIACMESTPVYIPSEEDMYSVKQGTLYDASQPKNLDKLMSANIQVTAVTDSVFSMPTEIVATKTRMSEATDGNSMRAGQTKTWELNEDTMKDTLHLIDNNFKVKQLNENKKMLCKVPFKERNVIYKEYSKATVYKAVVTDLFDSQNVEDNNTPMEYLCYSIGCRLESGRKYKALFKIVPHPYQGQQLIMIIYHTEQANDSVSGFTLNEQTICELKRFQSMSERLGVSAMVNYCAESVKGLLNYNGNNLLIQTVDLAYHTPLTFNLGSFKNIRAYLDTLIVGESRMGKSSTVETLRKEYGLGTFVSLAGNSATVPGLIGGSNKLGNGYQTKAGLIPQNHKGLMIFEEFGKCRADIIGELTDIRSSNEVRITRVSGSLTLPATVRMITLSNVKSTKEIRSIASYPHGISIVAELVGSAEDIARYDVMLVLKDRGNSISDPYWQPQEPFSTEAYRTRIRWVWSRTPEQIIISEEVGRYIYECANDLNQRYDSHIKIFGTEAWKKLARLAIAVAGYCVSTNHTLDSIIVTKEHVDFAADYFIQIYDNDTFKLAQYVEHERQYSTTDNSATDALNEIFQMSPGTVMHLEQEHKTSKQMLGAASGLPTDRLNTVTNLLIQGKFIKLHGHDFIPTERFRLTLPNIQRATLRRVELGSD